MQAGALFGTIILAIWTVSDRLKYVAYYSLYFCAGVTGSYYAWHADLIPHDHEMRGCVIAASNMIAYIMSHLVHVSCMAYCGRPTVSGKLHGYICPRSRNDHTITRPELLQKNDER